MARSMRLPESLLRKNPNLPLIEQAIDAFRAGNREMPVWPENGKKLSVEEDLQLGTLIVRAGDKVVYRSRRAVENKP